MSCDHHDNASYRHGNASAALTCSNRRLARGVMCKPHGVNLIGATEFRHSKSARPKKSSMCTRPFPPFGGGVWGRD